MDVKAPLDRESYARCSGVTVDLADIEESVHLLKASGLPYEFRTTVAPTFLEEEDIIRLAHQLTGARRLILQHFSPAHTLDPRCRTIAPYPENRLRAMQEAVNAILKPDSAADQPDAFVYRQAS
jgi:pyruvate formate lyase activating enzyme